MRRMVGGIHPEIGFFAFPLFSPHLADGPHAVEGLPWRSWAAWCRSGGGGGRGGGAVAVLWQPQWTAKQWG